jgi:hypothetical protein
MVSRDTYGKLLNKIGVAKKLNRIITETVRCLRLNVELLKMLNTACYIINRSPRVALDGKVAEEV